MLNIDNILSEEFTYLVDILVYPDYIRGVNEDLKNNPDIALLKLEHAVRFGPKMNAICLPSIPSSLYEGETMIIAGWGVTENLGISDKLMEAKVEVYPNEKCKEFNKYGFLKRYRKLVPKIVQTSNPPCPKSNCTLFIWAHPISFRRSWWE